MKTYYELIEETVNFDFNDVVLNSANYQYYRNEGEKPTSTKYLMRRIYMEKNVLKWVHVVDRQSEKCGTMMMMDWRGVHIESPGSDMHFIVLPIGDMMEEDEFFQKSLIIDMDCIDYELYTKIYKFYHTVLLPIIHF